MVIELKLLSLRYATPGPRPGVALGLPAAACLASGKPDPYRVQYPTRCRGIRWLPGCSACSPQAAGHAVLSPGLSRNSLPSSSGDALIGLDVRRAGPLDPMAGR